MAQTMERTVPAQGRLVVVPIPAGVADDDVLRAMRSFLDGHATSPRCAAFVSWDDDGALSARDIEPNLPDEPPTSTHRALQSALSALLAELFETRVYVSWDGGGAGIPATRVEELSMSFLREVHDFVSPKISFVALLTDWVDPGAIVRELRHIDGLRVIYGGVPSHWATSID